MHKATFTWYLRSEDELHNMSPGDLLSIIPSIPKSKFRVLLALSRAPALPNSSVIPQTCRQPHCCGSFTPSPV